ncbi:radical SAM protein [bacterium]|nr:radical SAM protein [bacterium]
MAASGPAGGPSVFGPVPSRRLGRSLGIDNVPAKTCDYGCVYCQVGTTRVMQAERTTLYPPWAVVEAVSGRVGQLRELGETVDYLTFVPTGEPTLDVHLGREIRELAVLGLLIAVITNGSLVQRPDVRAELGAADWVSVKVDAVDARTWRRINRPHGGLVLDEILDGLREFARQYDGTLGTETMLVRGLNDDDETLRTVAAFLAELGPDVAYVSVPTRPPARADVVPPPAGRLNRAFQVFSAALDRVELLLGYEGDAFGATGDAATDLLSITAVHPMRTSAVADLLARDGADWSVVDPLLAAGDLVAVDHGGETYYLRRARREPRSPDTRRNRS